MVTAADLLSDEEMDVFNANRIQTQIPSAKEEVLEAMVSELADSLPRDAIVSRHEIFALARVSLDTLAALAMPTVFEYRFPDIYNTLFDFLTGKAVKVRDFSKLLLGLPRGHAKTTFMKLFVLWCILYSQKRFILVVASAAALAENIIADICDMMDEQNVIDVFGNWRLGIEVDRQNLKKFSFRGRNIILAALGAGSSIRGLNLKNERPDIILMEDIQDRENAISQVQSEAMETWMLSTLLKAKSPKGCLNIFVGNMYPPEWCIIKKLKANPHWTSIIVGGILADGKALWEELHPLEQLLEEFQSDTDSGHPEIFLSEVMNDDTLSLNTLIDLNHLPAFPYTEFDFPQGGFILIDVAADKPNSDDTAIIRYEVYDRKPVAAQIESAIMNPGATIRTALQLALVNRISLIIVEDVAYQSSLLYWFEVISKELEIRGIQFVPINPKRKSKNARIMQMFKQLKAGELFFTPDCASRIKAEAQAWNPLKKDNVDNILDNLAYAEQAIDMYGMEMQFQESILIDTLSPGVVEDNCSF